MTVKMKMWSKMLVGLGMVFLLMAGCGQENTSSAAGSGAPSGSARGETGGPPLSLLKELVLAENKTEGEIPFDPEPINFHLQSGDLDGPHYRAESKIVSEACVVLFVWKAWNYYFCCVTLIAS